MTKYTDINKAIVKRIKSKIRGIPIMSMDVQEGIKRPSFFIDFDNIRVQDFMNLSVDKTMTVRIYYFSKERDRNKIENMEMQDELTDLFLNDNVLRIDGHIGAEIEELEFNVVDGVLHCYFNLEISEDYDRTDDTSVMEDLEIENL